MGRRKARPRAKTSMDLESWYLGTFYRAGYISNLTFLCDETITRGYTDEADRLLNYLVYAPQFLSFIFLTNLSRNMEYLMLSRNVTFEVSSLGSISSVPSLPWTMLIPIVPSARILKIQTSECVLYFRWLSFIPLALLKRTPSISKEVPQNYNKLRIWTLCSVLQGSRNWRRYPNDESWRWTQIISQALRTKQWRSDCNGN